MATFTFFSPRYICKNVKFESVYVVYSKPHVVSTVTFEDKKRENFERGNLELEKRRQALQEQQRKEQERLAALEREEQERKVSFNSKVYKFT